MKKTNAILLVSIVTLIALVIMGAMSFNGRVKFFGIEKNIPIPCGMKLENVGWGKNGNLILKYRRKRNNEKVETHFFREVSMMGKLEGGVIITESECGK